MLSCLGLTAERRAAPRRAAGTRRALPLAFRAAACVLALLQFALMAGARWDGAAVESMRAPRAPHFPFAGCVLQKTDARARNTHSFSFFLALLFPLAAYSVRTLVQLRELPPGVNCSHVMALAPAAGATNDTAAAAAATAVVRPLAPGAPLPAYVRQPSGSYTGAHTHHSRALRVACLLPRNAQKR
jgi:hypothetical protein